MAEKLADILSDLKFGIGNTVRTCSFLTLWQQVVDERVGRQTEAIKISNRVLYVLTKSSTWAHELTFLKNDIVNKFNQAAGQEVIRDIKFKTG